MQDAISVNFLGKTFLSPLVLTSGIWTTTEEFLKVQQEGIGAVTTKSFTYYPRKGNAIPVVVKFSAGMLNSVGLRNVGIAEAKNQVRQLQKVLKIPFFVSIFDIKIRDFAQLVLHLLPEEPEFIELNLSCPNVENDMGQPLANDAESAYEVVKTIKKLVDNKVKIIAKLTPNVNNIAKVAEAVERGGADAISAINAVSQGMVIDLKTKRPILGNKTGAVSGPAITPIAIRCVYEIYETVNIPIIGIGGITTTQDAIAMFMAGATLLGIGTAILLKGIGVVSQINRGIRDYIKENGYKSVNDLIGLAH